VIAKLEGAGTPIDHIELKDAGGISCHRIEPLLGLRDEMLVAC
jgi:hypothetical protein